MKKILFSVMALAIATMTFTACEDVPEPYPIPNGGEGGGGGETEVTYEGNGTLESPYTCADAINFVKALGQTESEAQVYVKGFIIEITEEYTTNYGNASFVISDTKEGSNRFTFWRGLYLGNKKYVSGNTQIKIGDEVIVCGNIVNYNGKTPETVQGKAFLYSLNGVTDGGSSQEPAGEAKGSGTLEDPFNAAAAIAYAKEVGEKESDKEVYIKGKVSSIAEQYGTEYGNGSFSLSDDGEQAGEFYVHRALYLGNQKYTTGDLLKKYDEVIVCGKVYNYKGNTPETVQAKAYLYSLNGKTGAGTDTPPTPPSGDTGSIDAPKTVADALAAINALEDGATTEAWYYIKGKVKSIKTNAADIAKYKNIDYYITDDGNNELQVYRGKNLNNTDFTEEGQLNVDDEVIVYGQLMKYKDKSGNIIPEVAQGNYIVKTSHAASGGDEPPSGGGGEVSGGGTITVAVSSFGLGNQTKLTTLTLSDGTTLTFDGGGNNNAPAYYTAGNGTIRMYPKNSFTINADSKKIKDIEIICNEYNNTLYNASGNVTAGGSKMTVDGTSLKSSNINASTVTVSNVAEGSGGATQVRMETLIINYAE